MPSQRFNRLSQRSECDSAHTVKVLAVVLTRNEAQHLRRCLTSLKGVVNASMVVDCFSTDATVDVALELGATVVQHAWVNHAVQFNWALDQLGDEFDWILRIDADEYLTPELAREIRERLPHMAPDIDGVVCGRRIVFQGKMIRFGGSPNRILRIFRRGRGRSENRWMDEHIQVAGRTDSLHGFLIDENLNSLTWWCSKHNHYASREAVELLNIKYGFRATENDGTLKRNSPQAAIKRFIKEKAYVRLPKGLRAFIYFLYRYVVRLGILDGSAGTTFHVLQGFWYRYLVDAKVAEVERYVRIHHCGVVEAISAVLDIRLNEAEATSAALAGPHVQ